MAIRHFLTTLFAVNLCIHLLRLPHLIFENGGGAFLLLFFLILNFFSLALLISEKVLDQKLNQIDLRSLFNIKKSSRLPAVDRSFFVAWYGLKLSVLFGFLLLFLYISCQSAQYFFYFINLLIDSNAVSDLASAPTPSMYWYIPFVWGGASFLVFLKYRHRFIRWSNQWGLPSAFVIMSVLFFKILFSVNDYEALKVVFYPDFSSLNRKSLIDILGHAMACLFVGLGFYKMLKIEKQIDIVEVLINAVIQTLILAIFVGVMVIPMIDQVRETAFGSNWIFTILPRWLSYGAHGNYYCALLFLTLSFVGFHVSVLTLRLINHNTLRLVKFKRHSKIRLLANGVFVLLVSFIVLVMQSYLGGWSGQSLFLVIDKILINVAMPLLALMLLWVVFRYTRKEDQYVIFEHQQLFYHNRSFFVIWRFVALVIVPSLIFLGWGLLLG